MVLKLINTFIVIATNMTWASVLGQALGPAFPHLELPTPSSLWTWGNPRLSEFHILPVLQNS